MIKKSLTFIFGTLAVFSFPEISQSACVEVSMSTCVGDFANGGDVETAARLLGNTSGQSLGILQDNHVRIYIASGSYTLSGLTNTVTHGFVGIHYEGMGNQLPQFHLDVNGIVRSTASAYFATSNGRVGIGASTASSLVDIQGGSVTIRGSGANLSVAGISFQTWTSSTANQVQGLSDSTGTLGTNKSNIIIGKNEGTTVSSITAIDCVGSAIDCTGSVSTLTITVNPSPWRTPFQIIVGTLGSVAGTVDIASNNIDGLNEALRQCGAMGLLSPSTASCSIFYKGPGVFTLAGATIPAGVRVWAVPESSVVWVPSLGATFATVYGALDGIYFDWGGLAYASRGIIISSSGSVKNFKSYNSLNVNVGTGRSSLFYIHTSSEDYDGTNLASSTAHTSGGYLGDGELKDIPAKGLINTGSRTSGQISIEGARYATIRNLKISNVTYGSTSLGVILVANSSHTFIDDCQFHNVGGNFLAFEGGNYNVGVRRSRFYIDNSADAGGVVTLSLITNSPVYWGSSSMTVITDNIFMVGNGATITNIIGSSVNGSNSGKISETWVSGNIAMNPYATGNTFMNVGSAGVTGTVLTGNKVDGRITFLSDSGTGTKSASLANFKGNVEQ